MPDNAEPTTYYIVITSNLAGNCNYETLQDALGFIKDQLEMGYPCTIKTSPTARCEAPYCGRVASLRDNQAYLCDDCYNAGGF